MSEYSAPFKVALYFRGEDLKPELVTERLEISPTKTLRKGKKRHGKQGRAYTNRTGIWKLETETTSESLSDHITELTSKLRGSGNLQGLGGAEEAFIDVFLCYERNEESESHEFSLTEENIKEIDRLGLTVEFTVTSYAQERPMYLGELVMEITVSGSERNVVHKNLTLIQADTPEKAYEKALRLGRRSESSYKNPKGQLVRSRFCGVAELELMYDELEDGRELRFDEYIGVSPEEIKSWIPHKTDLQAFLKPEPFRERDPDYRSASCVEMALDMSRKKE